MQFLKRVECYDMRGIPVLHPRDWVRVDRGGVGQGNARLSAWTTPPPSFMRESQSHILVHLLRRSTGYQVAHTLSIVGRCGISAYATTSGGRRSIISASTP